MPLNFIYPAALTALGMIGNAYILGGQIKGVKDDLGVQMGETKGDHRETEHDMKSLTARQTEMKIRDMAVIEKSFKSCGKHRREAGKRSKNESEAGDDSVVNLNRNNTLMCQLPVKSQTPGLQEDPHASTVQVEKQ